MEQKKQNSPTPSDTSTSSPSNSPSDSPTKTPSDSPCIASSESPTSEAYRTPPTSESPVGASQEGSPEASPQASPDSSPVSEEEEVKEIDVLREGDNWPPFFRKVAYKIGPVVGSGQFSTVFRAKCTQNENKPLVCKRIMFEEVSEEWRDKCLKQEMKILGKLNHEHIVRLYDMHKTRKAVYIFMDYAKHGTIAQYLRAQQRALSERKAQPWFAGIVSALVYIHDKGIAHRDIKLDNFLLNAEYKALLADFGFACLTVDPRDRLMKGTVCGTADYMAPEIKDLKIGHVYDAKATDMYSMGVALFEMLNFDKPFGDDVSVDDAKVIDRQRRRKYRFHGKVANSLSMSTKQLIDLLMEPKPSQRITARNTLNHIYCSPSRFV